MFAFVVVSRFSHYLTFYLHLIFAILEKVSFPVKFISNHLSLLKNVAVQVPTSSLHELFLWYG